MSSNNRRGNRNLVPKVEHDLNRLKTEVASEIGLQNYESIDKENLSSRQNGSFGGEKIVKKMVESYEQGL